MTSSELEEIQIVSKYDYELSKGEVKKIFSVYNECFYNFKCTQTKLIKKVHTLIGGSHMWRWYLAYLGNELVGIASYFYDPSQMAQMILEGKLNVVQVNVVAGENVCNVGVKEKFRRRGVARCLMDEIIDDYQSHQLGNSTLGNNTLGKDLVVEVIKGSNYLGIMKLYTGLDFEELDEGKWDTEKVRYLIRRVKKTT